VSVLIFIKRFISRKEKRTKKNILTLNFKQMKTANVLYATLVILLSIWCFLIWEGIPRFTIEQIVYVQALCLANIFALIITLKREQT
jgi:TM2 domain-containing membrane protein YozV